MVEADEVALRDISTAVGTSGAPRLAANLRRAVGRGGTVEERATTMRRLAQAAVEFALSPQSGVGRSHGTGGDHPEVEGLDGEVTPSPKRGDTQLDGGGSGAGSASRWHADAAIDPHTGEALPSALGPEAGALGATQPSQEELTPRAVQGSEWSNHSPLVSSARGEAAQRSLQQARLAAQLDISEGGSSGLVRSAVAGWTEESELASAPSRARPEASHVAARAQRSAAAARDPADGGDRRVKREGVAVLVGSAAQRHLQQARLAAQLDISEGGCGGLVRSAVAGWTAESELASAQSRARTDAAFADARAQRNAAAVLDSLKTVTTDGTPPQGPARTRRGRMMRGWRW